MPDALTAWIAQVFAPVGFGYARIDRSAYSLKHDFERSPGGYYITDAEFRAALIAAGYPPRPDDGYFHVAWYHPGMTRPRYIYTLSDPRTGAVRYVGQTCDLQARHAQHRRNFRGGVIQPGTWTAWLWDLHDAGRLVPVMITVETLTLPDGPVATRAARLATFMAAVDAAEVRWIQTYQTQGADLFNKQLTIRPL